MSNYNIQQMLDGYRNVVYRVAGQVDNTVDGSTPAGDIATTMLIDIATLNPVPTSLRIERVKFSIPHGTPLDVNLWWQATTDVLAWGMGGGDDNEFSNFGGLTNNAPPGFTGNIMFSTSGIGSTGPAAPLTFAFIVECVKQRIQVGA